MSLRRIVSLTLVWSLLVMLVSGIVLYIEPQGRVAYWAGWKLLGLTKTQWDAVHTNSGLLMLVAGLLHLYYNWRSVMVYLKDRARRLRVITPEFRVATLVTVVVVSLTAAGLPPLSWLQDLGGGIKDGFAERLGQPPYGHAEQSSLETFCRRLGLDLAAAVAALDAAGYPVDDPRLSLGELADRYGTTPQHLFVVMRAQREPGAGTGLNRRTGTPIQGQ